MQFADPKLNNPVSFFSAVLLSGFLLFVSNGLTGTFWFLMWIAPVPVLVIAFSGSWKTAFSAAFFSFLIGRLSWFEYLVNVMTIVPAVIYTILIPLISALIVLFARTIVHRLSSWLVIFAFPVVYTAFEFLVIKFSPDGSAGSIAYTQANFLPLVQIASLTGILGITFFISFIPSAISLVWLNRYQTEKTIRIISSGVFVIIAVLLFGLLRIRKNPDEKTIKAGLIVLDEKFHNVSNKPDSVKFKTTLLNYVNEINKLALSGTKVVVLPERAIDIDKQHREIIESSLASVAKHNGLYIVAGYTNYTNPEARNSCLVLSPDGTILRDYTKAHLIKGLEDQFNPGHKAGLFKLNNFQTGTAICKDMDFTDYIRNYGSARVNLMCIPAWDFVKDDWLHSRMSILRGVENGFSEIRSARQGLLTISDYHGTVLHQASASSGTTTALTGPVPATGITTLYAQFGDWFGYLILLALIAFTAASFSKKAASF